MFYLWTVLNKQLHFVVLGPFPFVHPQFVHQWQWRTMCQVFASCSFWRSSCWHVHVWAWSRNGCFGFDYQSWEGWRQVKVGTKPTHDFLAMWSTVERCGSPMVLLTTLRLEMSSLSMLVLDLSKSVSSLLKKEPLVLAWDKSLKESWEWELATLQSWFLTMSE